MNEEERDRPRFLGSIADMLLFLSGAVSLLLFIALFSLLQVTYLPENVIETITIILFLPLIMDLFLISPNLPVLMLILFMVPILLIIAVIIRIILPKILRYIKLEKIEEKLIVIIPKKERRYSLPVLLAISVGATIGPSTFVLSPYSVKHFGWLALPGMILASVSAIMLAYGYSRMLYYSKKLGGKIVGGPSFVGNAYGLKHYLYIISRFTMWMGNVALAAFNLLISIELVAKYILPLVLTNIDKGTYVLIETLVRVVIFMFLSLVVLAVYRNWEKMVDMQIILAIIFICLFFVHSFYLYENYQPSMTFTIPEINLSMIPNIGDYILGILMSAAYVYLMVFGFQEVQSLGDRVKLKSKDPEERLKEVTSILKKAMVGGAVISAIVFLFYVWIYVGIIEKGYSIPETPIPALDLCRDNFVFFTLTLSAIALGIITTYVPAFVAAIQHLKELISDVFLVDVEELTFHPDPYIVIVFMAFLLLTNAEYIIHLTDFAVLISMSIIAFSWYTLRNKVIKIRTDSFENLINYILIALVISIITIFAVTSQEIAVNSVVFMMFSTLIIMFFSYDLLLIEMFTITIGILSLIITPPLIDVISEAATFGLASPINIAIAQALTTSFWLLYFVYIALLVHLIIQHRDNIMGILNALMYIGLILLKKCVKGVKSLIDRIKEI